MSADRTQTAQGSATEPDPAGAPATVKSADRVLDLFELLGQWDREMSHSDIADALKIPKSSLTQLLRNLTSRGYVEFVAETKGYRLGSTFTVLARKTGRSIDLVACAEPVLAEITAQTQESSALNRLKGTEVEVVATVSSSLRLVSHMRLGDLAPLYATSGGKVILAHLPETMQADYLADITFKPITKNTIRTVGELRRQMATIRQDGLAYSMEEFTPGIVGMATAVLSETG
jgi:DNA-binding IclR family transcriptional regulator